MNIQVEASNYRLRYVDEWGGDQWAYEWDITIQNRGLKDLSLEASLHMLLEDESFGKIDKRARESKNPSRYLEDENMLHSPIEVPANRTVSGTIGFVVLMPGGVDPRHAVLWLDSDDGIESFELPR